MRFLFKCCQDNLFSRDFSFCFYFGQLFKYLWNLRILSIVTIYSVYSQNMLNLSPHILSVRTVLFCFLSTNVFYTISKKHWDFAYESEYLEWQYFLQQLLTGHYFKIWRAGELLDLKPSRNKTFYCFWLTKTLFRVFGLFAEWASNLNMSTKWTWYSKPI
jgi:hypothetical protein